MMSLRWIADFWFLALVFALSWSGFHFCLMRRWPLTAMQWRRVDYVWLFVTAISILFMAADVQTRLAGNITAKEELVQKEQRSFQLHIASEQEFYCKRFAGGVELARGGTGELASQVQLQCDWLTEMTTRVQTPPASAPGKRWGRLLPKAPAVSDPMIVRDHDEIRERAAHLDAEEADLAHAQQVIAAQWWVEPLRLLGPLLLLMAFALRLTKVSGEIRLAERDRPA
jgi:hypothetical protein